MTDAIRELFDLLVKKEKSGSDYTAKVTRVDGNKAYVQIDGADITDTPVSLSVGANPGDVVRVRVADGRAWLVGNDSAPPNDSAEVKKEVNALSAHITDIETENITGDHGWINLKEGKFNYGGGALSWNGKTLSVKGTIEASSGEIGGWSVYPTYLKKDATVNGVTYRTIFNAPTSISADTYAMAVAAYENGAWDYRFAVKYGGALVATDADITGTITATSGSFTGTVNAEAGTIGGWTLVPGSSAYSDDTALYKGTNSLTSTNIPGVYIGSQGLLYVAQTATSYCQIRPDHIELKYTGGNDVMITNSMIGVYDSSTGSTIYPDAIMENGSYLSDKYAPLSASTQTLVSVTVGSSNVMSLGTNTTHVRNRELYINCSIVFSGARSAGTLLVRFPYTFKRTQYITVCKNGDEFYQSSVTASTGDALCPVAFTTGDTVYITGVVTLD